MSRFNRGWIKLHRDLLEKDIFQNMTLFSVWVYLLMIANYKESQIIWMGRQRILQPGQILIKMRELSEKWECSTRTIWKWFHYLEKTGRIVLETETRGTIITICNYKDYQTDSHEEETPSKHQVNTEETPSKHQVNYSKEVKKIRRKEERELHPLAALWNQKASSPLKRVISVNPTSNRGRACAMRWRESNDPELWMQVIERINASDFCMGKNDRHWTASFDWLIRPDTATKVLEGIYDNRQRPNGVIHLIDKDLREQGIQANESPSDAAQLNERLKGKIQ